MKTIEIYKIDVEQDGGALEFVPDEMKTEGKRETRSITFVRLR